jgi:hypothetical protein
MEKRCLICKIRLEENASGKYKFMCSECVESEKDMEDLTKYSKNKYVKKIERNDEVYNLKDKLTENAFNILLDCYEKSILGDQSQEYLEYVIFASLSILEIILGFKLQNDSES